MAWRPAGTAFATATASVIAALVGAVIAVAAMTTDELHVTGTTQLDGPIELGSVATPAALAAGTTQNYNPGSRAFVWQLSAHASNSALGGIVAPAAGDNEWHLIQNIGAGTLTLNYADGGSAGANRFVTPRALPLTIAIGGSVFIRYDFTDNVWRSGAWSGEAFGVRSAGGPIPTCIPTWADGNGALSTCSSSSDDGATLLLGAGRSINIAGGATFTSGTSPVFNNGFLVSGPGQIRQPQFIDRIVPAALTSGATTNDWNPTDIHTQMFVAVETSGAGMATLTGIGGPLNGEIKTLCNHGPGAVKLLHNNAGSVAANRFKLANGEDVIMGVPAFVVLDCVSFRYNANSNRYEENWRNFEGNNTGTPTASVGTLEAGSSNHSGTITGIGANNTVTLTFSNPFTTRSRCQVTQTAGATRQVFVASRSASAPVITCFDMAGAAANCVDFTYSCRGQ